MLHIRIGERPTQRCRLKLPSNTSMLPVRKFVAYKNGLPAVFPVLLNPNARPFYTVPLPELLTTITASSGNRRFGEGVPSGSGMVVFHASIVPSSVAKIKGAGPKSVPSGILMSNAGTEERVTFATWPVGAPVLPP
jgi:hypothetical protein